MWEKVLSKSEEFSEEAKIEWLIDSTIDVVQIFDASYSRNEKEIALFTLCFSYLADLVSRIADVTWHYGLNYRTFEDQSELKIELEPIASISDFLIKWSCQDLFAQKEIFIRKFVLLSQFAVYILGKAERKRYSSLISHRLAHVMFK